MELEPGESHIYRLKASGLVKGWFDDRRGRETVSLASLEWRHLAAELDVYDHRAKLNHHMRAEKSKPALKKDAVKQTRE